MRACVRACVCVCVRVCVCAWILSLSLSLSLSLFVILYQQRQAPNVEYRLLLPLPRLFSRLQVALDAVTRVEARMREHNTDPASPQLL